MISLAGNSILIVDSFIQRQDEMKRAIVSHGGDCSVAANLTAAKKFLKKHDVDMIICSYFVADGLIHQLIDWCKTHVEILPIFIGLGAPGGEKGLFQRHMIADVWDHKMSTEQVISNISQNLFNAEKFKENLLELIEPKGIKIEFIMERKRFPVVPIEITSDGLWLSGDEKFKSGDSGLLRFTIFDSHDVHSYTAIVFLEDTLPEGQLFKIHESYTKTWDALRATLAEKQLQIMSFVSKAVGF